MPKLLRILVVEDNPSDVWMIRLAIEKEGLPAQLDVLSDGEQALCYINQQQTPADYRKIALLVLDLNLPRYSGHHVLRCWQNSPLAQIPVIVVTSSDSPHDQQTAQQFTPHYFYKPFDFEEFLKIGTLIRSVLKQSAWQEMSQGQSA